ncbi:MAG: hypothetical protein HQM08_02470 [Candidatus Riflebacteria bacterium]|nr:hypothetical protein [Candidatus Riflebacteria bacterium]
MKPYTILRIVFAIFAVIALSDFVSFAYSSKTGICFDDAFMFTRYASNFLEGHGFSWNRTEGPVYGCTSIFYLFIVTAFRAFSWKSDQELLLSLSEFFGLLSVLSMCFLAYYSLEKDGVKRTWTHLLIFPVVLFSAVYRKNCVSGMETTFAIFLNSLFILSIVFLERSNSKKCFFSVILGYFSFLSRPENLIPWFVFPIFYLSDLKEKKKFIFSSLLLLTCDSLIKIAYFGGFLPLSFFVKKAGFYKFADLNKWNPLKFFSEFLSLSGPFILLTVAFFPSNGVKKGLAFFAPLSIIFPYLFSINQIMGYSARFFLPSLPYFIGAAFFVLNSLNRPVVNKESVAAENLPISIKVMLIFFLFLMIQPSYLNERLTEILENQHFSFENSLIAPAKLTNRGKIIVPKIGWMESIVSINNVISALPKKMCVAMSEHGLIGAMNPEIKILDLTGLHNRDFAKKGFSDNGLFSANPDLIWFPHSDYIYIRNQIFSNQMFRRDYIFYPDLFDFGFAINKNSPYLAEIENLFESEFRKIYHESRKMELFLAD